jgi:hypothetical protein
MENVFAALDRNYDAYDNDIAILNIYFDAASVLEFGTQASQGWVDFFSNVGGLLGLCLGLSIVTIVELLWLTGRLINNAFRPVGQPGKQGQAGQYGQSQMATNSAWG